MRPSIYHRFLAAMLATAAVASRAHAASTPLLGRRAAPPKLPATAGAAPMCFRHPDPMKPNIREMVACDVVKTVFTGRNGLRSAVGGGTFVLNFACPGGGPTCQKAQDTFKQAFEILQGNLILNQDVVVNASFVDFCATTNQCRSDGFQVLGGAAPGRTLVLQDDDGVLRAYPQALVKQLNLPQHQRFSGSDIFAQFNAAAKFYFPGDTGPMATGQSDFLFVVLHEMIHGLGFTSAWDDYLNQVASALTPGISGASTREGFVFSGFVENAFDRFVIETATNTPLSARTAALNKIFAAPSTTFPNLQAFSTAVQASDIFKANAGEMFRLSTTAQSLAFITAGKQKMPLETSLSPYQPGSSVSHADLKTFSDTSDFLMRFRVDPGVSLSDAVQKGKGGPLGPTLLGVLESLGYATKANPNPFIRVKSSADAIAAPGRWLPLAAFVSVLVLAGPFSFSA